MLACIDQFLLNVPHLKIREKSWFFDVFAGYQRETLGKNKLRRS